MENERHLLELCGVSVGFPEKRRGLKLVTQGVSLHVNPGEAVGIVGESGSGKSVSMLASVGLLSGGGRIVEGSVRFLHGEKYIELNTLGQKELNEVRGDEISMIFQEPMTSLNPLMSVGHQVEEMLVLHTDCEAGERREKVLAMLKEAGLSDVEALYGKYPHQLSGGMRQRVMIAMAMILRPKLLIADEPTTALDVTVQAKILKLLKKFQTEYGTAILLISHDLGVIKSVCSRAVVMCGGRVVEQGGVENLFGQPKEDYTKKLLAAALGKENVLRQAHTQNSGEVVVRVTDYSVFYEEKAQKTKRGAEGDCDMAAKKSGLSALLCKKTRREVVKHVSFELYAGEIVGIVGESGCGKSTLAKALAGLNPLTGGTAFISCSQPQMVFQDPYGSLNPTKTIGWLLTEPLRLHHVGTKEEQRRAACEMLDKVGLGAEYYSRYPGTLSGGQRQRVAIAMAIMLRRRFILLDEPVSALDVTVQEQILVLLVKLQKEFGLTYLFISHDMNVIHRICDRVFVMYGGEIVESGEALQIFDNPKHPYTKKLLGARV
ncbi:MAG: ABC transporter ATP-binding protein [Lachnospiraceae bacterium]|nr:ABC transporter ATP-binding protein [Lachnospiraceae bacterium]